MQVTVFLMVQKQGKLSGFLAELVEQSNKQPRPDFHYVQGKTSLCNFFIKNCILITGNVMAWRKGNKEGLQQHQGSVKIPTQFCLHTVSARDVLRSLVQLTELCQLQGFHANAIKPGQLDAAFISKKKVKLLDRFMPVFSRTG